MGCDGGTIPKRLEMVREKKKTARPDEENLNRIRWSCCAHSELPLGSPLACDYLGNLFSLEAVIDGILKKNLAKRFKHIKGKKDLVLLNPSPNPTFKSNKGCNDEDTSFVSPFQCPILNLEMNGKHSFVAIASCGHVLSERAFKELKSNQCIVCQKDFTQEDVIALNPGGEQLEVLKTRLKARKSAAKAAKKEAKKDTPKTAETTEKSANSKKRKEPTPVSETTGTSTLGIDVQHTLQKALQAHDDLAQKSAVYRSMFGPDKRAKVSETPEETFMIAGTHRAYI